MNAASIAAECAAQRRRCWVDGMPGCARLRCRHRRHNAPNDQRRHARTTLSDHVWCANFTATFSCLSQPDNQKANLLTVPPDAKNPWFRRGAQQRRRRQWWPDRRPDGCLRTQCNGSTAAPTPTFTATADADTDTDIYPHADMDADRNRDGHRNPHANAHRHSDMDGDGNAGRRYQHAHADVDGYQHGHADMDAGRQYRDTDQHEHAHADAHPTPTATNTPTVTPTFTNTPTATGTPPTATPTPYRVRVLPIGTPWDDGTINLIEPNVPHGEREYLQLDARTSGTPGPEPYTYTKKSLIFDIPIGAWLNISDTVVAANLVLKRDWTQEPPLNYDQRLSIRPILTPDPDESNMTWCFPWIECGAYHPTMLATLRAWSSSFLPARWTRIMTCTASTCCRW